MHFKYFVILILFPLFSFTQPENIKEDTALIRTLVFRGENTYLQQPDSALQDWQNAVRLINRKLSGEGLDLQLKNKLKFYLSTAYNGMAFIYRNQGDVPQAIDFNERALKLREEINNKIGIAESLNNIGVIYDYQNEGDKALEYYGRSLKILEEIGEKEGMGTLLNNMAYVYSHQQHDPDKAIEFYKKALAINIELNKLVGIGECYNNIGAIYRNKGNYAQANELLNKGLEIRLKANDKRGIASSYKNLCELFFRQKNYPKAIDYGLKSLDLSKKLGYPENIMLAAEKLDQIYRATGEYKKALENYELFVHMKDSIGSEKNRKAAIRTQLKHDYEKKAVADSIKVADQNRVYEAEIKQEKTQHAALYAGIILIATFSIFMYNRFRITRKQKYLIEIKEKETNDQKTIIEAKHKEITDSINYARRIQQSLLPQEKYIEKTLKRMHEHS